MSQKLTCIDCGREFEFTDGEAAYYAERGLYPPKRCKKCRVTKRQERGRENPNDYGSRKDKYPRTRTYKTY